MSRRVLQLTPSYSPVVGGIEDHVYNLYRTLPEHGYDPIVLTPDRDGVGSEPGIHREPTRLTIQKSAFAPGVVTRLFTLDYDLLHVHAPFHFGLEFATMASKLRSIPLVVTVHMYDARKTRLYQFYEGQVYDRCLNAADRILPTTEDYVHGYDVFQRNQERVTPVPMSVDTERYRPIDTPRDTLGWDEDERVVLFVGAMEKHHFYKDIELLVEAVAGVEEVDRLVLVGSGDKVPELKQAVKQFGIAERVEFTGYIEEEELPTYYSAADLFALPSKADRGEAFGIVLLEAMACGTPVLTTDIPGVRTVVGDGGVVVAAEDVDEFQRGLIEGLTGSFEPQRRIGGRYTLEAVAERIADVYDQVLVERA